MVNNKVHISSCLTESINSNLNGLLRFARCHSGRLSFSQSEILNVFKKAHASDQQLDGSVEGRIHLFRMLNRALQQQRLRSPAIWAAIKEEDTTQGKSGRLIGKIPIELRVVVHLSDVELFRYQEITQILEITLAQVHSRLHRGRTMLSQLREI